MAGAQSSPLKILVVRPDRLGDVILSTPVFEVIKRHFPRSRLSVMVREQAAPLVRGISSVDEVMIFDPVGRHAGFKGFRQLLRDIRSRGFRIAVVLQSNPKVAFAVLLARIRYRVGPLSKPHTFLCFNRGLRQRRSQVEMHEADYNMQLLRRLGIRVGTGNVLTAAHVADESKQRARAMLESHGWTLGKPLVVVHPGMGGSALNWPENHYVDLVRAMVSDGRNVVVTGGKDEEALLRRIETALGALKDKAIFYGGANAGPIDELAGLFSWASLVVAPSTGPLHLAVALGKPVVCFYPPIRVQSAIRWGPYLSDSERARILVPEIYCGQDFSCRGTMCNHFPCMKSLSVNQARQHVESQLLKFAGESTGTDSQGIMDREE